MLLQGQAIPGVFDGNQYNLNLVQIEASFLDIGGFVISGLTLSAGTGLTVAVAAGVASIGGRVNIPAPITITGLTDNTLNHCYLLNTGLGTSNTTGTAPANSTKLGTATTAGGVVSSVALGRNSGRQQFRQPQALIPGGSAAGPASAGQPASLHLAGWAAAAAEGVPVYGLLPGGALTLPLNLSGGSAPTAAAGTAAGASPPAPVVAAGSNDARGKITWGTGTGAGAGDTVDVTLHTALSAAPIVLIIPTNAATAGLLPYLAAATTAGFSFGAGAVPADSQANTVYAFNYLVIG